MGRVFACVFVAGIIGLAVYAQNPPQAPNPDTFCHLGPDSLEQEGVPKGALRGPV